MIPTVSDAKAYLGLDPEDCKDNVRLELITRGVYGAACNFVQRPLAAETKVQSLFGGVGSWALDYRPIRSVTSITDPAGHSILPADYLLLGDLGILSFRNGRAGVAFDAAGNLDRWTITYVAGIYATKEDIPAELVLAMLDWTAEYYHRPQPDVQGMTTRDQGTSYIPNPNARYVVPQRVAQLLGPERSIGF